MSVDFGAFPRKIEYYYIKIESFDGIGMIGSEKIKVKDSEIVNKIKNLIKTETQQNKR